MIRIAIADDHAEMRVVLKLFLGLDAEMQLVGEAVNGQEAIECVRQLQPDVLVMDVQMPIWNGLVAARQIADSDTGTRVILISLQRGSFAIWQAKEAGAMGYLPKDALATTLLDAIRTVHRGETYFVE